MTQNKLQNSGASGGTSQPEWRGYTLEELRYQRALAAIRCEIGSEKLKSSVANIQNGVKNNGLRSLFFSSNVLSGLKFADYLILGFKLSRLVSKLWKRSSRK